MPLLRSLQGAALVEWLLGMASLLTLAAITVEFAHWQTSRHLASIALMEAARAGSTKHAHPLAMEKAFLHAMRARFPSPEGGDARMLRTFKSISQRTGMPAWEVQQLEPDAEAFRQGTLYKGREIARAHGKRVLRHDMYERDGQARHLNPSRSRAAQRRSIHGRAATLARSPVPVGPLTLHLRLIYRQPALFPIIARLAAQLVSAHPSTRKAWAAGLMVIVLEQKIEMQSDAVQW